MREDADLTLDADASLTDRKGSHRVRHLDLEALSLHIDDDLGERERSEAESHLASCTHCALDFEELHLTVALLRGLPQYDPPRSFVLGQEFRRIKHRSMPQPIEPVNRPVPAYIGDAAPAAAAPLPERPVWHSRLLPSSGVLKVSSGLVGIALAVSVAGDMAISDPAPQGLSLRPAQAATSIWTPASERVSQPDSALAIAPLQSSQETGTESSFSAFGEVSAAPTTTAATPSPWRVAQIGLGMLLLWLLVSLGGRMWMDHQERMPN